MITLYDNEEVSVVRVIWSELSERSDDVTGGVWRVL